MASRRAAQNEQQALLAEIHGLLNWLELSLESVEELTDPPLRILAINQVSLRLLNSAVRLQDAFSHRIETAAVSRADLETAIMTRHNLSGLRLRFASRHA